MKKFVCTVCGYVYEGEAAPGVLPHLQGARRASSLSRATSAPGRPSMLVGVGQGRSRGDAEGSRPAPNFTGECSEVGMYLAMARVAHREGYPEIGLYWEKAAYEEAEHAAKFAELLGEVVTDSTKKNLEMRVEAENGATAGKFELAKKAKQLQPRRHSRHRARDGPRRSPSRQGFRRPAEAVLRQVRKASNHKGLRGLS